MLNRGAYFSELRGLEMKYLTTLEVAHDLKVSKQTLLNWLYAGKIPEPPRNRKGYRLWSAARVSLVKRLIREGRIHKRTVVHREASNRPEVVGEFAREVNQFLRDGDIDPAAFLRELARLNPAVARPWRGAAAGAARHRDDGRCAAAPGPERAGRANNRPLCGKSVVACGLVLLESGQAADGQTPGEQILGVLVEMGDVAHVFLGRRVAWRVCLDLLASMAAFPKPARNADS